MSILESLKDDKEFKKRVYNMLLKDYGKVIDYNVDSKQKIMSFEILLNGDIETFVVTMKGYQFYIKDGVEFFRLGKITASREWVEVFINKVLKPKYFPDKIKEIPRRKCMYNEVRQI